MKLPNLGAIRVIGLRAGQVIQMAMVVLLYLGFSGHFWLILGIGLGYAVLDYLVIYPQEQRFALEKNHLLMKMLKGREGD